MKIITKEIMSENNTAKMIQMLNESFKNNRHYINSLKEKSETYQLEVQSINPFENEEDFLLHWFKFGFVIGKGIISENICDNTILKLQKKLSQLNLNIYNNETWLKDKNGVPLISRGFLDIYHDKLLSDIRQNKLLYLYHTLLWQDVKLNTTFDRLGIKIKGIEGSEGLPLHVDQNPNVHPNFQTIQGVLALNDCSKNGTVVVPKSNKIFNQYKDFIKDGYKGEYVELEKDSELFKLLNDKKIIAPLKKGDIISWDSRTTHTNITNNNNDRYVMYLSTGKEITEELYLKERKELFISGNGKNVRNAYCHASKKPRFSDSLNNYREKEELTELGNLLYGFKSYDKLFEN